MGDVEVVRGVKGHLVLERYRSLYGMGYPCTLWN